MSYRNLKLESGDGVAVVTLDRPEKLNALNRETLVELAAAFSEVGCDPEIRGVIVTGSGEKAFAAGADIGELLGETPASGWESARTGQRVFTGIERLGKPVVAAINGFALGGGCELALACHVRVASETAKIGVPEVKLGILCGYGGTQRLPRLIGRGRALELLLTGEMIDAPEALRIGLVNRVVPLKSLLPESHALLAKMIRNGPISLRLTLEAVQSGLDQPLPEALRYEAALFGLITGTEDRTEGLRAFLEKRPPRFQGL